MNQTLYLTPGDDFSYTATIDDEAGADYNLTDCSVWFTVKRRQSDADIAAIVSLYWVSGGASSGITVATPSNGGVAIRITAAQTAAIVQAAHRWDLQLKDAAGAVRTIDAGVMVIQKRATIRVTTP
jgi:hypothetical protein